MSRADRRVLSEPCLAILAWIAMAILLAGCATVPAAAPQALKVMAFNVRLPVETDGANRWQARRELAAKTIRDAAPDLVGTQELFKLQGDYLVSQLPDYAWFGEGRRGGDGDEHMGVFYRKDRLRVLESGDFWLSDTPTVPGSISWGHPFPRMVTWAQFERIADGRRFYFFNTHLPYRAEDDDARLRGARLLLQRIAALPPDAAVIVTGDFNTGPESAVHAELATRLGDAWVQASRRSGPQATFHNFTGQADRRIDWILMRGFEVERVSTIDAHDAGRYPSDHFPIMAELR